MGRGQLRVARDRLRGRHAGRQDPRGPRRPARRWRRSSSSTRPATSATRSRSTTLRERGRAHDTRRARRAHRARVTRDEPYTIIYTSGTTGPPKGCVLSHGNYRDVVSMCERDAVVQAGDIAYLFLPLAHSFALLIQLAVLDMGATLAYFGGDPKQIVAELSEVQPDLPPVGPADLREALHARHRPRRHRSRSRRRTQVGLKVRALQAAGQEVPAELQAHFDGGRGEAVQERPRGVRRPAAPGHVGRRADRAGDPRVLLRLRRPGARGLRDDRDGDRGDGLDRRLATASARSAARCPGWRSGSPTTARCCSRARTSSSGYYKNDDASFGSIVDGWLHTGDLGARRRGRLPVHHRPQEGHHHHRGRQEPHAGQPRERPQAVALDLPGGDARRPPARTRSR